MNVADTPGRGQAWVGWKRFLVLAEIGLTLVLVGVWLLSEDLRTDKSLWVLFLFSIPAEALVAVVPHEPIILFFSASYDPLTVALVATAGTVTAELINYSIVGHVAEASYLSRIRNSSLTARVTRHFDKAPFGALLVAGFTPVPFYPFRFLVVLAHYSRLKYAVAIVLSRGPRFYILAVLGREVGLSDQVLIAAFVVIAVVSGLLLWKNRSDAAGG